MGRVHNNPKDLPEFDFDNLPEAVRQAPATPKLEEAVAEQTEQTYAEPDKSIQVEPKSTQPEPAHINTAAPLSDRKFDFQQHDWVQRGREIICSTCPMNHSHGTFLKAGQQLVGSRGSWRIVAEGGHCATHGRQLVDCAPCKKLMVLPSKS